MEIRLYHLRVSVAFLTKLVFLKCRIYVQVFLLLMIYTPLFRAAGSLIVVSSRPRESYSCDKHDAATFFRLRHLKIYHCHDQGTEVLDL